MNRRILFNVSRSEGIPEIVVSAIPALYVDRKVIMKLHDIVTKRLPYQHGIIQGSAISPLLFILYVNQVSVRLDKMDSGNEIADHLAFVDDFVHWLSLKQ